MGLIDKIIKIFKPADPKTCLSYAQGQNSMNHNVKANKLVITDTDPAVANIMRRVNKNPNKFDDVNIKNTSIAIKLYKFAIEYGHLKFAIFLANNFDVVDSICMRNYISLLANASEDGCINVIKTIAKLRADIDLCANGHYFMYDKYPANYINPTCIVSKNHMIRRLLTHFIPGYCYFYFIKANEPLQYKFVNPMSYFAYGYIQFIPVTQHLFDLV